MRLLDLTKFVLHQKRAHPVQDARRSVAHGRATGGFNAHQSRWRVGESGENAGGIRPTADAGDNDVRVVDAKFQ